MKRPSPSFRILRHGVLMAVALVFLMPFIWMVLATGLSMTWMQNVKMTRSERPMILRRKLCSLKVLITEAFLLQARCGSLPVS